MVDGIEFAELLRYEEEEVERWRRWFEKRPPEVLDVSIGEGETTTIRGLLVHIFGVELRYADRLLALQPTSYESLRTNSLDEIFQIGAVARQKLREFLARATDEEFTQILTFETRKAGTFSASKRKIVAHAIFHGIRHWAQVATALRQQGHRQDWQHDFLVTRAMP